MLDRSKRYCIQKDRVGPIKCSAFNATVSTSNRKKLFLCSSSDSFVGSSAIQKNIGNLKPNFAWLYDTRSFFGLQCQSCNKQSSSDARSCHRIASHSSFGVVAHTIHLQSWRTAFARLTLCDWQDLAGYHLIAREEPLLLLQVGILVVMFDS